jgi:hypothetical protein
MLGYIRKESALENGFTISTDKNKLDVVIIHDYLCNRSYWGQGRTIETVRKSIENSLLEEPMKNYQVPYCTIFLSLLTIACSLFVAFNISGSFFVAPPWNLGMGASQAILGIAAFGLLLSYKKIDTSKGLKIAVAFSVIPALVLDLIFSHYPKPGHITGFLVGLAMGSIFLREGPMVRS